MKKKKNNNENIHGKVHNARYNIIVVSYFFIFKKKKMKLKSGKSKKWDLAHFSPLSCKDLYYI